MHILLIHQAFVSLDEAGGTRHFELARILEEHGHQVTVISSPISYLSGKSQKRENILIEREKISENITILRAYTYQALHRSFLHRMISFLSFMMSSFFFGLTIRKVDLVWGTSPPIFQGFTTWLLARLKGVPFLFEVRDLWPDFAIAVGVLKNRTIIRLSHWLEHFLYKHADKVIVNSPGYIEHVKAKGARSVELIANGVDPSMFDPNNTGQTFRLENNLVNQFIVLYAGAHGLANDLEVILRAAQILKDRSEICFVLIGDGKEKPNLQKQAQDLHLANILFLPPVSKTGMAEVLAGADCCIAILKPIELFKTTYPNKVFDYMAASRPVILAIDGVIREVVEKAGAGIFTIPGDPQSMANGVNSLFSNPDQAIKMGKAGRIYIEKYFNRLSIANSFLSLLDKMGKENGRKNINR